MNDAEIRQNFHRKVLRRQHARNDTLVIDELGLNHGKCRADIAVVNGQFLGYEIKSDNDTLRRLEEQIKSYNAVFDKISIIVGDRHVNSVQSHIPEWWGVIMSTKGPRGAINFETVRRARTNKSIDPISMARLLWRDEAAEILTQKEVSRKILSQPRAILYEHLAEMLSICELRRLVRMYLKKRKNWRCPESPSYGDSYQPSPML